MTVFAMISRDRTSQMKWTRTHWGRWWIALNLLMNVALFVPLASAGEEVGTAPGDHKPMVGAYYYPWYDASNRASRHTWRHAMRLHLTPPQAPNAGLYDSRDPAVIGEHIAQSLRGGIDFWAVSWWGPHRYDDKTFRNHILTHPDADKLRYAILYESTGRLGSFDQPHYRNWIRDLQYLEERYFDHPNYLRINDRPVLFVYLTREYFRDQGDDALAEMRRQFPDIFLVADDVFLGDPAVDTYQPEWAKGFDAVTAYDIYGQSIGPLGSTQKAIDFLAANYRQARAAANSVGVAFIPGIAPGYNDTAVRKGHPGRARYFTDRPSSREGDVFRAMIQDVALPNLDPQADRILMVTSFNEWYEDSQIEATQGTAAPSRTDDSGTGDYYTGGQQYEDYGHLYLDILKQLVAEKPWSLLGNPGLHGWKASEVPGVFTTLEDGTLKVDGGRSHLFWMGTDSIPGEFTDFEFSAKVKTTPGSNSGIFFHTKYQETGWPTHGYEVQVNSTHKDRRKTGSLYAVKDVMDVAPSTDGVWFHLRIRVEGKTITVAVDGNVVNEYTEPADPGAEKRFKDRRLGRGTIAIQGHDPKSITYYREIKVRAL